MRVHRLVVVAVAIAISACSSPSSPGKNTYILAGLIRDSSSAPIEGATVQVTAGSLMGQMTTTDSSGRFRFTDPAFVDTPTTVLVLKAGYLPVTQRIDSANVVITLSAASYPIEGNYTVTFTAASECSVLPSSLRRRAYPSTIAIYRRSTSPLEGTFTMELSGSDFFPQLRTLSLSIRNNTGSFFIASFEADQRWMDDLPVYERLGANEYFSVHGKATVAVSVNDTAFTTTFDGIMSYCPRSIDPIGTGFPPNCAVPAIDCRSDHHQLTGSRR